MCEESWCHCVQVFQQPCSEQSSQLVVEILIWLELISLLLWSDLFSLSNSSLCNVVFDAVKVVQVGKNI